MRMVTSSIRRSLTERLGACARRTLIKLAHVANTADYRGSLSNSGVGTALLLPD